MRRFVSALAIALVITSAPILAQNQIRDVQTVGCLRLWKPATDPAKMPSERQPGVAGTYLLTPLFSGAATAVALPTYFLAPSVSFTFWQHVGHQVEITGTAQPSPTRPTTPAQRPEESLSTDGMPRLTVSAMAMVSESCP